MAESDSLEHLNAQDSFTLLRPCPDSVGKLGSASAVDRFIAGGGVGYRARWPMATVSVDS